MSPPSYAQQVILTCLLLAVVSQLTVTQSDFWTYPGTMMPETYQHFVFGPQQQAQGQQAQQFDPGALPNPQDEQVPAEANQGTDVQDTPVNPDQPQLGLPYSNVADTVSAEESSAADGNNVISVSNSRAPDCFYETSEGVQQPINPTMSPEQVQRMAQWLHMMNSQQLPASSTQPMPARVSSLPASSSQSMPAGTSSLYSRCPQSTLGQGAIGPQQQPPNMSPIQALFSQPLPSMVNNPNFPQWMPANPPFPNTTSPPTYSPFGPQSPPTTSQPPPTASEAQQMHNLYNA
jgi:hypothetical protein